MMSQAPAMPLWTDALIGDTTHLSAEEFGAYLLILIATWRNNGQPFADNPARLARICRVTTARWATKLRPAMVGFFNLSDGLWRQKRLEKEWTHVMARQEIRSLKGKAGADVRWSRTATTSDGSRARTARIAAGGKSHAPAEWKMALEIFGKRCLRCGSVGSIEKDHVISLADGGDDAVENLQPLCMKCNADKSSASADYRPPKLLEELKTRIAQASAEQCVEDGNHIQTHIHTQEDLPQPLTPSPGEDSPSGGQQPRGVVVALNGNKPRKAYAFEGDVIKLNQSDFEVWRKRFFSIPDLTAELTALDSWFVGLDDKHGANWFHRTSAMLNTRHQKWRAEEKRIGDINESW